MVKVVIPSGIVYSSKYSSVAGLFPVTSGLWTPFILNLALSKLPLEACPATVKRTVSPTLSCASWALVNSFHSVSNAFIFKHCAVGPPSPGGEAGHRCFSREHLSA